MKWLYNELYFQTSGYCRAPVEPHVRCCSERICSEKNASDRWQQVAQVVEEGTVSCLRHPLQDDGADETTVSVLRSALATINQPS